MENLSTIGHFSLLSGFCTKPLAVKYILCFYFSINLMFSCSPPGKPDQSDLAKIHQDTLILKSDCDGDFIRFLEDTLFSSPVPELEYLPDHYTFFVKKLKTPRGYFGIVANPGFFMATYTCDNLGNWERNSCSDMDGFHSCTFTRPDLNFDSHPDLWLDASDGGVHGNHFSIVFLYDPQEEGFYRDTTLELENLSIDKKRRQLRSRHYSSVCGGNAKRLYGWQHDSLVLIGQAIIQGCLNDSSYLTWSERKQGNLVFDSMKAGGDTAWVKFEKLLWEEK